jgi:hypothetical protein
VTLEMHGIKVKPARQKYVATTESDQGLDLLVPKGLRGAKAKGRSNYG